MKKTLSILLAITFVFAIPISAIAETDSEIEKRIGYYEEVDEIYKAYFIDGWFCSTVKDCILPTAREKEMNSDDIVIFGEYEITEEELKIPSKIDGHTVSAIVGFGAGKAKSLYIPKTVKYICDASFFALSPEDAIDMVYPTITGSELQKITVSKDNEYYSSKSGVLYNKDKTRLIQYPSAKEGKEFIVPMSVTDIQTCAFGKTDTKHLKTITITPNVEDFHVRYIPETITKIYFKNTKMNKNFVGGADDRLVIPEKTVVYCFKNSTVHKQLKAHYKNITVKFLSKPKTPDKAVIKSAKWKKGVKLSIKKQKCSYFKVYRFNKKESKYNYIGYTKSTSFTDKTAKKGKTYKYKVAACNKKNYLKNTGKKSKELKVKFN